MKFLEEKGALWPEVNEMRRATFSGLSPVTIFIVDWWLSGNGAPIDTNSRSGRTVARGSPRAHATEIKVARKVLRAATTFDRFAEEPCIGFVAQ